MEQFIRWCAFVGAWFLVAGPVYQAALEMSDEDFRRDELGAAAARADRSAPVSAWWWLVPPVHYVRQRRRSRADRAAMMATLTPEQVRSLVDYLNKATGWLYVAVGGTLIAVKETWELAEVHHWPHAVFWVLIVVMAALALGNTVVRMQRNRRVLDAVG